MDAECARDHLLGLPHVVETEQWGGVVFWVGDKALGGKMFVMLNPDGQGFPVSYAAGPERYADLLEIEGMRPAPYLARAFWVAAERWDALRDRAWIAELTGAHTRTLAKLPAKTRTILTLPKAEQRRIIAEHRKQSAASAIAGDVKTPRPRSH